MAIFSKATQMMKSLYTPFGSLIAVIVFLLVVIAVLRMTGMTVGMGANAHVGRLHGSFSVEGFEEHASWFGGKKKKRKMTSDLGDRANKYAAEANEIQLRMQSYARQYYSSGTTPAQKNVLVAKYTKDNKRLTALNTAIADTVSALTEDTSAAIVAKDSITKIAGYAAADNTAAGAYNSEKLKLATVPV